MWQRDGMHDFYLHGNGAGSPHWPYDLYNVINVFFSQHRINRKREELFIRGFCNRTHTRTSPKAILVIRLQVDWNVMHVHPNATISTHRKQCATVDAQYRRVNLHHIQMISMGYPITTGIQQFEKKGWWVSPLIKLSLPSKGLWQLDIFAIFVNYQLTPRNQWGFECQAIP